MTSDDIPLGMQLKNDAGWNQTPADWKRFLDLQPEGCFVAEWDGRPVGTATTSVFGSVGWIAMVLVNESYRHRGIGTQLVQQALSYLDGECVTTARLDATPLGRPVYERMGFVAEHELVRLEGTASAIFYEMPVVPARQKHHEAVFALDQRATGTSRRRLVERLLTEHRDVARVVVRGGSVMGYAMLRPGSRALQIGPAIAASEEAGRELCEWAFGQCAGQRVFVDIPRENLPAIEWARARGLREQRKLTRMCRGEPVVEQIQLLWASSGPEKG